MAIDPKVTNIYHITDVTNLPAIIEAGGLKSDAVLAQDGMQPEVIGYAHIKQRRMHENRIDCQDNRFVGEFVPFYFCPRSPMLFTINRGNTGRPAGCQQTIVHLVSTVAVATKTGAPWAISFGNAGASYQSFSKDVAALEKLKWDAINANSWAGRTNEKSAEFLVADFFPINAILDIGCHNEKTAAIVSDMISNLETVPTVQVRPNWYY
jgi:hypothetical protein